MAGASTSRSSSSASCASSASSTARCVYARSLRALRSAAVRGATTSPQELRIRMQLVAGDRTRNTSLLFRHAEAAGIMIVIDPGHYAGHLENAWVLLQKITLGIMHVTQPVRREHMSALPLGATEPCAR